MRGEPYVLFISQHVSDLGDIPGLSEDLRSQKESTARTFAFKAFRCYHLAESYVAARKWAESMGLMDRALQHLAQTLEQYRELRSGQDTMHPIDKARVLYSSKGVMVVVCRYHASVEWWTLCIL